MLLLSSRCLSTSSQIGYSESERGGGNPAPLSCARPKSPATQPTNGKDGALYFVKRFCKSDIGWYIVVLPTTDT